MTPNAILSEALNYAKNCPEIRLLDSKNKVLWTGIGNLSGLHGFAWEILKEKFEKAEIRLTKKLKKAIEEDNLIKVERFINTTRDRGTWVFAKFLA